MDKISIIVPIYNCEKYIQRCIESILSQKYDNYELILVNDGSTDSSYEICKRYSEKNEKIILINQKNQGVSIARNNGIKSSTGEWITFVDSDDWIEQDIYKKALFVAKQNNADLIQWQYKINGDIKKQPGFVDKETEIIINNSIILDYWKNACWTLLVRKEIISKNNIQFPENITMGEDRYFTYCCYGCVNKIIQLPEMFYNYSINPESVTANFSEKKIADDICSLKELELFLKNNNIKKLQKSILMTKIRIKDLYIGQINPPDFYKWRNTFKEINIQTLFLFNKTSIKCLLILLHLDKLVINLLNCYKI